MLLLGPDGENVEVGSTDLTIRRQSPAPSSAAKSLPAPFSAADSLPALTGSDVLKVGFDRILSAEIVDGYRLQIRFTDFQENLLKVKTFCQAAIDVAMLQKVHDKIKVGSTASVFFFLLISL